MPSGLTEVYTGVPGGACKGVLTGICKGFDKLDVCCKNFNY
jgi:hypothetical protein